MYTRLIGSGRYVSCLSASASSPSQRVSPYASISAKSCPSTPGAPLLEWTCPVSADAPDRLNGLRGVDGRGQQTAPGFPGCVQAGGGGRGSGRPLGVAGGRRAWVAGPAGAGLAALGCGSRDGGERRAGADAPHAAGGAGAPRRPEPG